MAHGKRAKLKSDKSKDYWSPRPGNRGGGIRSPWTKKQTHRIERRNGKKGLTDGEETDSGRR